MNLNSMTGYKLFQDNGESIHMIRIIRLDKDLKKDKVKSLYIYDYDREEYRIVSPESLRGYTPLKPDGILTVADVEVPDEEGKPHKDVIVTATKYLNIEFNPVTIPYAVCRQSITDIFNNLVITNPDKELVGLSVNQDTCPTNFDFKVMFAASKIGVNDFINFYRSDVLDDLYEMMSIGTYNKTLKDLYLIHCDHTDDPKAMFMHEHGGWCDNLKLLLDQNNFQADIDQMLGITTVGFEVAPYLEEATNGKITYNIAREDFKYWLSYIFKINIKEASVLEYDHDINLADFNDNKYFIIRDIGRKLYLIVYTTEGEYLEADLEAKYQEMDFSTKFKIDFYNKYNRDNQQKS